MTPAAGSNANATTTATVALVQRPHSRHRAFFLEALRAIDDVAAVALLDPTGGTAAEARSLLGEKPLRVYADLDSLLRAESPAMVIVTLTGAEAPAAITPLLEAGLHVLAEKPSCVDPDDFARLADLAGRKERHLMLALCNRAAAWVPDARRIVQQDGIGRLYAARVLNVADQTRIWQPRTRDWSYRKADAGGGHLLWLGIHWLDMLLYLTGERVAEVQAMAGNVGGGPIDVEDLATVNLRLAGGAQASLISGYVLDADKQIDLTVWGAKGWLRFDAVAATVDWHSPDAAMHGAPNRHLRYDTSGGDLYTNFTRACLRACLDGTPPPSTAAEGLTVLRTIFAAYEAAETGRTVKL
jgi:predicted dehydrogenase